jgi:hypothetical protein
VHARPHREIRRLDGRVPLPDLGLVGDLQDVVVAVRVVPVIDVADAAVIVPSICCCGTDGAARCRESVAVVVESSTTTGALVLARLSRAFTPSLWRTKMSCAPSGTPANANRPSAPTTTDIPVPPTTTCTPAGLAFTIPDAMTICPDTTPMP